MNLPKRWEKEIQLLRHKKYRIALGKTVIEGKRLVGEALVYARPQIHFLLAHESWDSWVAQFACDIPVYRCHDILWSRLSIDQAPSRLLALIDYAPSQTLPANMAERIVIANHLQDPGNLGTLLRSAEAFGCDLVITDSQTVSSDNPKVIKASMGSVFRLNLIENQSFNSVFSYLARIPLYGLSAHRGDSIWELKSRDKWALIVGNEGNGISDEWLPHIRPLTIPLSGAVESLNAAHSVSIALAILNRPL